MSYSPYDYKRFAILYVDDEEKSLKAFTRVMEDRFRVLTARNAEEGYRILEQHKEEIGVLVTDQRMPGEKGVQLLERARQLAPRMLRILATAYSDLDAAVEAVNSGAIYKYISKPWDPPQLELTLKRALEFFIVQRERDQLLREKLSVLHHLMITDRVVSLGIAASGLGHYVRNSLVAVRTFLDLAPGKLREENVNLEDLRNPNFWRDFYASVQGQVSRITRLLTELESAANERPRAFDEQVDLRSVVETAVLTTQPAARRIEIENRIPESLPKLHVDGPTFLKLFQLFIQDEMMCLPAGSKLSFNASLQSGLGGAQRVRIEMTDDGPGLPVEALRSVFDPFFLRRDDPQEFGINLMACYFIVYHHGGTIAVRSLEGRGTTFVIELPLLPPNAAPSQDAQDFLSKVMMNEALWERLLTSD